MITKVFSHNFGIHAVASEDFDKVRDLLEQIRYDFKSFSATDLRNMFLEEITKMGWSGKIKVDRDLKITIPAMKNGIGLCFQTGNMGRFYPDTLKLETLYRKDKATSAIYIIPTKKAALIIGSNIAYYERAQRELELFKHIITIPIVLIGIE